MKKIKYGCKELGDYLTLKRREKGLSQIEFAKKLSITASHLCNFEKNKLMLSIKILSKVPKALGLEKEARDSCLFEIKVLYLNQINNRIDKIFKPPKRSVIM